MKKYIYFMLMLSPGINGSMQAQCGTSGCNSNTYVQSSDPNTIEYDNMISTFHSTMVREASKKVLVWGENIAHDGISSISSPTELNTSNYPGLTGTILKFAAGSSSMNNVQFAVLTTAGLFVWGVTGKLMHSGISNTNAFTKVSIGTSDVSGTKADGLPQGVHPEDVKMLFGSYQTLAITTCNGEAWVLSMTGNKNGDGTTDTTSNNQVWHKVKTGVGDQDLLTGVVAVRGHVNNLMALTNTGKIFTWGNDTYLGNGSATSNRLYATEMTLPLDWPAGAVPKMIGMTKGNTYYLLASDGSLFSLGGNSIRQLGIFNTTTQTSWVHVKKSSSQNMDSFIAWISPQEHDTEFAAINALTTTGKLYAWGSNSRAMIGGGSNATINDNPIDPIFMPGGLNANDGLMAVETGGHTTIVVKQCTQNFGYVGHRVNGSMADGTFTNVATGVNNYSFSTARLNLCGANTEPTVTTLKICPGTSVNLNNAHTGAIPTGADLVWYTSPTRNSGTEVANPATTGPGTYYAFYIPQDGSNCPAPIASEPVVISYLITGDSGYEECTCKIPIETGTALSSKFGISTKVLQANNWPTQVPNGHMVLDAAKKGMVITHMTSAQINALTPIAGMIVYDTDVKCVKLYRGNNPTVAPNRKGWVCIQPGCN